MSRRQRDRERSATGVTTEPGGRKDASPGLSFTRWTALFGGAGIATILAGFALLAGGSLTFAPILLVVGFLVLVPIALVR